MEPKIRFKGYMFGWVSEAIGLYYNFKNGLNKSKEYFGFGTPIVNFTDVFNNRVLDYASLKGRVFVTKEEIANYSVQKGDLFFTRTSETLEEIGYPSVMLSDSPQTVYSGFVLRGRAINNDPLVDVFKSYVFFTTSFRKEMIRKSSMTTRALTSGNRLKEMIFTYPKAEDEQFKIGNYFLTLDNKIQTTSKKLESLKKLKSASLVAMFPQQGKTTPKVRFKGFEGEWKKVKFLEIFEFLKNNSLSRAELSSKGDFINIHYGDILIKYGDLVNIQNEELTYIRDCRIGQTLYKMCSLQNGDIIIADAAEDYSVGKCSEIVNIGNNKVVSGLHTIPCRPLITFAQGYLGHYINSNSYHNQLLPLIQGSKISSISKKTLSQTSVFVPSYEEQQAIASFFRSLDRKIALETARLEKLKQIKLACLDKMFV